MRQLSLLVALCALLSLQAQRVVNYGTGANRIINDMVVWDGKLIIGGRQNIVMGDTVTYVAGWDGVQTFDFPGAFPSPGYSPNALEVLDGVLYAGGADPGVNYVARWDGSTWQTMDQGLPAAVNDLCVYDGQLIAAGRADVVCAWNGTTWDTLGTRFNQDVLVLAVHEGSLFAGGRFTANVNGEPIAYLARWNGSTWEEAGGGLNGFVSGLLSRPEGLVVAGPSSATTTGFSMPQRWAILNGEQFSVPELDLLPRYDSPGTSGRGLAAMPDGSYAVSDHLIRNGKAIDLGYDVRCAAAYNGTWFVGGENTSSSTFRLDHAPINAFSELIPEGRHHVQVDAGPMSATVTPSHALFERHWDDGPGLEVPKGDSVHAVYSASPWLLGAQNGLWHASINSYHELPGAEDTAYWAGPQDATVRDAAFFRRYHQVWLVDQAMIDHHAAHWNDEGYSTPYMIASWPGNGNSANGEPERLAPFQDTDADGLYEPQDGEHPLIRGHRAAYWMVHGEQNVRNNMPPMEFDLHAMVYNYDAPADPDRHNATFFNLQFVNRSAAAYDSVRFALFADMDIGGGFDDLTQCDTTRNLWMTYNSDDDDRDTMSFNGYGVQPPAAGFKLLNHPMIAHRAWSGSEGSSFDEMDAFFGAIDGAPVVGPAYSTRFQYYGGAWLDTTITDRRNAGVAGPFTWPVGDTLCFDLAVMYARANSGGPLASLAALVQRADAVQLWYDQQDFNCPVIENVVGVSENNTTDLSVFPNPTTGLLTLTGPAPDSAVPVTLMDLSGRVLLHATWPAGASTARIDLGAFASGCYLLHLHSADGLRHEVMRVVRE